MLWYILDIIAPKKCLYCDKYGKYICQSCYESIRDFEEICYVCKNGSKHFCVCDDCKGNIFYDAIFILKHYKRKGISKAVKQAKFYNKIPIFSELSFSAFELFIRHQKIRKKEDFCIVSVPSHWRRKWQRWYNSSEVFAKYFSKVSGFFYDKNIVKKIKHTPQQSKLQRKDRMKNIQGAFVVKKQKHIFDKNVIIIDDVVSSWATINEMAKILKQSGAKKIIALVIASN